MGLFNQFHAQGSEQARTNPWQGTSMRPWGMTIAQVDLLRLTHRPVSALGHEQTFRTAKGDVDFAPKSEIDCGFRHVC
jgi:hypothetical protein